MKRLVLADDSRTIETIVKLSFEGEEYEVVTFQSALPALDYLRESGADIVLVDLGLPELDGYEFCRRLRLEGRAADIPLVLLSGSMERVDDQRALEVGVSSSLAKPFDPDHLVALVEKLCSGTNLYSSRPRPWPRLESPALDLSLALTARQCRASFALLPLTRWAEDVPEPEATGTGAPASKLSAEQFSALVEVLSKRLPEALREALPQAARETLDR